MLCLFFYVWPFLHVWTLQRIYIIFKLNFWLSFSDYVVIYRTGIYLFRTFVTKT